MSATFTAPAAIEQLKTVTAQAGAEWFPSSPTRNRRHRRAAMDYAKKALFRRAAGGHRRPPGHRRSADARDRNLHATLNPVETLFVVDAMQGQDAVNTAKAFRRRCR